MAEKTRYKEYRRRSTGRGNRNGNDWWKHVIIRLSYSKLETAVYKEGERFAGASLVLDGPEPRIINIRKIMSGGPSSASESSYVALSGRRRISFFIVDRENARRQ